MPVLELPGKGISEQPYDRIVADTLAQLQAFVPEYGTLVEAYVKETELTYHWNGSAWAVG